VAMLATFGVVLGAAYMLWLTKRVIFGVTNNAEVKKMHDVNKTEILMLGILTVLVIVFGFYPAPLIETFDISVNNLINIMHFFNFFIISNSKNNSLCKPKHVSCSKNYSKSS
jgi:NADH-quinone oxidoreductase subunit M